MRNTITLLAFSFALIGGSVLAAELPKALVEPYLQVQAALADDKVDGIAAQAKAMQAAASALGAEGGKIAAAAKKLEAAKDITAARAAFGELSEAVVSYAEKTKADLGAIQIAYCPMADKPWLQKDKEIRNPYYGASMLTCGNFKK